VSNPADRRAELHDKFADYGRTRDNALRDELAAAHLGLAEYLADASPTVGSPSRI